jgi:hypothetical protein
VIVFFVAEYFSKLYLARSRWDISSRHGTLSTLPSSSSPSFHISHSSL